MHLHTKKKVWKKIKKTGGPVTHILMTKKNKKRKESETEIEDALFLSATTIQFYPMKITF